MTTIPSRPALPVTVRRPRTGALARVVDSALVELDGLAGPLDYRARHTLDRTLRAALSRHILRAGEGGGVIPAVRVACAHLAAGDVELAQLALRTARERLE